MEYQYIDLSHNIEDGMITYDGLPPSGICDFWSREESAKRYISGTSFHIGKIEMVGNTGTYIDTPFHRYEEGKDLSETTVDQLVDIKGVLISVPHQQGIEINESVFKEYNLKEKAVLIHTGWDRFWRTDTYFRDHPYLTESAAQYLEEQQVKLVGIDSYNIDDTKGNRRPVHSILLKNKIFIVEHLCSLNRISDEEFDFSALPLKIKGMGSFSVRAYARIKN
ncbi:cyclase family protein [Bacteroidota bacterium]